MRKEIMTMVRQSWLKLGTIRKGKNDSLYIKIESQVNLALGSVLSIQNPREKIDNLVKLGKLSEEEGMKRKNKIPDYIRYEIYLAPQGDTRKKAQSS